MKYPMWHIRFTDSRNALRRAAPGMFESFCEDNDNPAFKALYDKMHKLLGEVDIQLTENYKRIKK